MWAKKLGVFAMTPVWLGNRPADSYPTATEPHAAVIDTLAALWAAVGCHSNWTARQADRTDHCPTD